jgi:hypothetical protein
MFFIPREATSKALCFELINQPALYMHSFEEYLVQKKINGERFQAAEPARYEEWKALFAIIHPDSFTAQKKFLINDVRRRYHLNEASAS